MEIDIIIVNYHSEKELKKCVASLKNIDVPWNLYIADNNNVSVLDFPGHTVIPMGKNTGFSHACNTAFTYGKSEGVLFLNPDTRWCGGMRKMAELLESESCVVAPVLLDAYGKKIISAMNIYSPIGAVLEIPLIKNMLFRKKFSDGGIFEVPSVHGAALLIKRKDFEEIGGFDEKFFLYFEDMDLCLRLQKNGFKVFINSDGQAVHKGKVSSSGCAEQSLIHNYHSRYVFLEKHFGVKVRQVMYLWNTIKIFVWYIFASSAILFRVRNSSFRRIPSKLLGFHLNNLKRFF